MEIKLTEIQITPVKPNKGLIAFVNFVLDNSFFIGDVAIHDRPDGSGIRLVYPAKILYNGAKIQCFYPINKAADQSITKQVSDAYLMLLSKIQR